MVFRAILTSILILGQATCMAQIEKLTTTTDVLTFIDKVAPRYDSISPKISYRFVSRASADSLVKTYHIQSFEKVDLDGNGLTDLLFNGTEFSHWQSDSFPNPLSFAILSFGNDSFEVKSLNLTGSEDIVAHALTLDGKPYIQTIRITQSRDSISYHIDTLVWRYDAFVEKGPKVKRSITRIDYNAWNGLNFSANITLRIANDSVRLQKEKFEGFDALDSGGVFLTRLDANTSQKLYGLLDAMDFVRLKDTYHIDAFDATTGTIIITYDNGKTKTISDYGTCGTYGLAALHQLLYGLTATQRWVNADSPTIRRIDSLQTDREVLGLVRTLWYEYPFLDFEPDTSVDALPDYGERLAAFNAPRWQKADLDGNGYTDLLFNGYLNKDYKSRQVSMVVLSFGGDSLLHQEISYVNGFFAARIIRCNGHDNVKISYQQAVEDSTLQKGYRLVGREDTLTALDGQIVELPPPALHHIEKLSMHEAVKDSIEIGSDTIRWYKNDTETPEIGGSLVPIKDSINLYILAAPEACQQLRLLAAGIKFDRLNPDLLASNKFLKFLSSTWYIEYDGGIQRRLVYDGLSGSYRLQAMESRLWDLEHKRTDWKLIGPINTTPAHATPHTPHSSKNRKRTHHTP